jgi:hypothetical protein
LEDLLHLKRAERPPAEFWAGFDQELRQKQLAALVERKSWWRAEFASLGRSRWLGFPVGAAAILAVTLVSVQRYSSQDRVRAEPRSVGRVAMSANLAKATAVYPEARRSAEILPEAPQHSATLGTETAPKHPNVDNLLAEDSRTPSQQITELAQHVAGLDNSADSVEPKTLDGALALQLASPDRANLDLVLVDASHSIGFEDRSISAFRPRRIAEALPTAVAVTESRRSRLMAALGSAGTYAPELTAPERATRSVIRHLADDGWDRSMSRLQAQADQLSIRF